MQPIVPKLIKDIRKGRYNTLESTHYFLLQENLNLPLKKASQHLYRIVTTGFPRYKVSGHNNFTEIQKVWDFIHTSITLPLKSSSKKVVKAIRLASEQAILQNIQQTDMENESFQSYEYASEDELPYHHSISEESNDELVEKDKYDSDTADEMTDHIETDSSPINMNTWQGFTDINETGGRLYELFDYSFAKFKFEEIIKKYWGALFMPSEPKKGKQTLHYIREKHLVKNRQFLLVSLSLFAILLRYSSFDFFIFLLIGTNFALLYVLRNAKKINIQLAKRSVKNRVGWARQYFGGFIKRHPSEPIKANSPLEQSQTQSQTQPAQIISSPTPRLRLFSLSRKRSSILKTNEPSPTKESNDVLDSTKSTDLKNVVRKSSKPLISEKNATTPDIAIPMTTSKSMDVNLCNHKS